ncbi:Low complexity coiled coil [Cryptosporidium sp. chipmunk genotype I]|uniref:Low complexity coiled coil n=1 Tax=Cryptosporidium sp. chipmunk genotype I TaxID=1280935 RepID=UPI00351AA47D|nr:Low complexity coiled coil [Cryptosporidium sp. chipmunk genotype I]
MSINEEDPNSQVGKALGNENEEKSTLLARIKELEAENKQLKEGNRDDAMMNDFKKLMDDMDGAINYSMQVVQVKDEKIKKINEKILENNTKWKGYVKLLVDQICKKNILIDNMKEEMDKFFEKTKKQEIANRENNSKLASYEELIQIDQQLLKQSKQIEAELNNRIRKLEEDNKKYLAAIKTISESTQKKMANYTSKIDNQQSVIRRLASIVDNFRGRFLYNNIGRQNGILNQINKKSSFNDNSNKEIMNPLEYEFGIIWSSSQEKLIQRKCELLELSLNLKGEEREINRNYLNDLLSNKSVSVLDAFSAYSDYISRILGLYDLFSKSNIFLQYFQYKALRYLQIYDIPNMTNRGEMAGIIQWVCNLTIEIGFLILDLGSVIMSTRDFSRSRLSTLEVLNKDEFGIQNSQIAGLPSLSEIKTILKWIDNISQDALNDNLNQNITYEEIKEFKNLLHAKNVHACPHENIDSKNAGIELLPVCCVDAIMNINISLSILLRLNIKSIQEKNLDEIYKKSLEISEKFYSKCGNLCLNGIHYPIDYRLYLWNGLYWIRILGQSKSEAFKVSFEEMIIKQNEIYETIHNPGENQGVNMAECVDKLFKSIQDIDTNLDDLLNPIRMELEMENSKISLGMDSLPEIIISSKLQKLILNMDDQIELDGDVRNENGTTSIIDQNKERRAVTEEESLEAGRLDSEDMVSGSAGTVENVDSKLINTANSDSPKKTRYENSTKLLNEKIQSLRKELTEKEVAYSSFEVMQGEYKKLQDHKQLLMHRIEEQEFEMRISQERLKKYEDTVKQMKIYSDNLKRDLENLHNIPKIKAYSELDVLEPVYLRRLIRLMSNKLYELEMNRWNEKIAKEDPNRILKSNYSQKMILGRVRSKNSLDKIAERILERERRREEREKEKVKDETKRESTEGGGESENMGSDFNSRAESHHHKVSEKFLCSYFDEREDEENVYTDILALVEEFKELKRQIMFHRCSIPIMTNKGSGGTSSFEKEWEEYAEKESKLKYKLHIMKTSLQGLISGTGKAMKENSFNNSVETNVSKKIGKILLKVPSVGQDSVLRMINSQSNTMKVNICEWNEIVQNLVKITT